MDSLKRLNERELPSKDAFYSKLNESGISDEDWTIHMHILFGDSLAVLHFEITKTCTMFLMFSC